MRHLGYPFCELRNPFGIIRVSALNLDQHITTTVNHVSYLTTQFYLTQDRGDVPDETMPNLVIPTLEKFKVELTRACVDDHLN